MQAKMKLLWTALVIATLTFLPVAAADDVGERPRQDETARCANDSGRDDSSPGTQRVIGAGGDLDPLRPLQWGLDHIQAPAAWGHSSGRCVIVAVLDTGINATHPDLAGKTLPEVRIYDPPARQGTRLCDPHGHQVAAILAAATNNGEGMAGTAPDAMILPIRVTCGDLSDATGNTSVAQNTKEVAAGIVFAADHGARVISMSLGWDPDMVLLGDLPAVHAAIDYAWGKGAVLVAAAGNRPNPQWNPVPVCDEPAAHPKVICVGATNVRHEIASYSRFDGIGGNHVLAPGGENLAQEPNVPGDCEGQIVTANGGKNGWTCDLSGQPFPSNTGGAPLIPTSNKGLYGRFAGTSAAVPFVSGVAALLASQGLANDEIVERIKCTADAQIHATDVPGRDRIYGHGRVNALRAVTDERNPGC